MSFRNFNQIWLVPGAQILMIFGIIALCQPWSALLHRYGPTMTLIGLVGFLIVSHVAPDEDTDDGAGR